MVSIDIPVPGLHCKESCNTGIAYMDLPVLLDAHIAPRQKCQETVSQGKTSSGRGCQTKRSILKPSSLPSVTVNYWRVAVGEGVKVPCPYSLALRRLIVSYSEYFFSKRKKIKNTSAVNSTFLWSILIFASCAIHRPPLVCPTDVVRVSINSRFVVVR